MKVSLNIFLDELSDLSLEPHNVDGSKTFTQVDVVDNYPDVYLQDHLYVGPLSLVTRFASIAGNVTFIALRDRFNRDGDAAPNIIIVNDDLSVQRLYAKLNNIFNRILRWQEEMLNIIIHERPIQDLLIASQDVLDNFISISDSALSLLAHTPDIPPEDPISQRLVKNGYHDEESISFFKRSGSFLVWQNSEGLLFDTEHKSAPFPVVSRIFRYDGVYYTHVVMVCSRHDLSYGLLDKFNILLSNVEIYLSKINCNSPDYEKERNSFINRILDGSDVTSQTINEVPGLLSLSDRKRFWLLLLLPDVSVATPMGIISHRIKTAIPDAKLTVYHQSLLALISTDDDDDDKIEAELKKIEEIISEDAFYCGISLEFSNLSNLKEAYRQSTLAMNYGKSLVNVVNSEKFRGPVFRYKDYYIYMALPAPDNLLVVKQSHAYAVLNDIRENDFDKSTNNFQLLYAYLFNCCHAGNTAKVMYMSRNNVAYRVQRLVDIYGFDLDDYLTRMELQITYEIMHLYPTL